MNWPFWKNMPMIAIMAHLQERAEMNWPFFKNMPRLLSASSTTTVAPRLRDCQLKRPTVLLDRLRHDVPVDRRLLGSKLKRQTILLELLQHD